jgi:hypothetical protein
VSQAVPLPEHHELWAVAPKHWAAIPAQRRHGPTAPRTAGVEYQNGGVAEAIGAAVVGVALAAAAVILVVFAVGRLPDGTGTSVADLDRPSAVQPAP